MAKPSFEEAVDQIIDQDQTYDGEAYRFVRDALDFTMRAVRRDARRGRRSEQDQHISGQDLLEGIRKFALQEFGPMAQTVLEHWGVHGCEDFGAIVFKLVDIGVWGKTDTDSIEDFKNGYTFEDAFVKPFLPERLSREESDDPAQRRSMGGKKVRAPKIKPASKPHEA